MKSLLFSVDHVYREDGTLTPLEINTSTASDFATGKITQENFTSSVDGFYEHEALDTFMSESNFTKLVTIAPTGSVGFFRNFAEYYGYEFTNHNTLSTDVTVPNVEDADDSLIIRISYNTYAIVDDLYARDNYEFHNIIQSESFASPIAFTTNSLDTVTQFDAPQSASYPNYVIKARLPEYEANDYPKLFNITSSAGLASVKASLINDDFLQKFEFNSGSGLNDEGRTLFLRSFNLALGDGLENVLNIGNYSKANSISTTNAKVVVPNHITGSNRQLEKIPSAQWYPTFHSRQAFMYHNDEDDFVVKADNTLLDYENVTVNTSLKAIEYSGQLNQYMTGSLADIATYNFTSSTVTSVTPRTEGGVFINITASFDGVSKSWYDGYGNTYLVYRDGAEVLRGAELGYLSGGELLIGDKIFAYDSASNELASGSVENISFEFKDKETSYLTVNPVSQFLVQLEPNNNDLFLIQHNTCGSECLADESDPATCFSLCSSCGKSAKFCIDCGGGATSTCSGGGPPKCFMAGSLISMADGTFKPIEEVKLGDYVKSRNGVNEVKEAHIFSVDNNLDIYSLDNIKVTYNHPVYIDGEWTTPKDLNWNSKKVFVDKLYNLVTDDSFTVGGIIASGTAQDNLNVIIDSNGISKIINNKKTA